MEFCNVCEKEISNGDEIKCHFLHKPHKSYFSLVNTCSTNCKKFLSESDGYPGEYIKKDGNLYFQPITKPDCDGMFQHDWDLYNREFLIVPEVPGIRNTEYGK